MLRLFLALCGLLGRNIQQYSNYSWSSERRVLCVPTVCACTSLKPGKRALARSPQAGPGGRELGCVGARAPRPRPARPNPTRPGPAAPSLSSPPARAGRAPCPFKEAGRTTRTFLTGVFRRTRITSKEQKDYCLSLQTLARFGRLLGGSSALAGFPRGPVCLPAQKSPQARSHSESGHDVPRAQLKCSSPAEAPVPGCPSGLVRTNTLPARGCAEGARGSGAGSPLTSGSRAGESSPHGSGKW